MKVYVTRYALTEGILEVEADGPTGSTAMVTWGGTGLERMVAHGEGKEWHRTRANAVARAMAMRQARVKSLQRQIERLQALEF